MFRTKQYQQRRTSYQHLLAKWVKNIVKLVDCVKNVDDATNETFILIYLFYETSEAVREFFFTHLISHFHFYLHN